MFLIPHRTRADPQIPSLPHDAKCVDTEMRLSFYGHMHCKLHTFYQQVFPGWGCNCSTGECRPSTFQRNPNSPEGVDIMVAGEYFPVPKGRLRNERNVPEALLQWDAHVCCTSEPPNPTITCAWINASA